jgi:REase_DpnII-MboI
MPRPTILTQAALARVASLVGHGHSAAQIASGTAVETKMALLSLSKKELGEELLADIAEFRKHNGFRGLFRLVYDPKELVSNPAELEGDLSGHEVAVRHDRSETLGTQRKIEVNCCLGSSARAGAQCAHDKGTKFQARPHAADRADRWAWW